MPFRSQSQRRKFYAMKNRGQISPEVVKDFEDATPKGKKLPERVSKAAQQGFLDALDFFGLKEAAEEIRLKIPNRQFHGFDQAMKAQDSESLAGLLGQLAPPKPPEGHELIRDHLDRQTAWGAPSHLGAGDTAGRVSDMGQNTNPGNVF